MIGHSILQIPLKTGLVLMVLCYMDRFLPFQLQAESEQDKGF